MPPPMLAVADGGADHRRLQTGERALQQAIFARAGGAANRLQELIGREAQEARRAQAVVLGLDDLAGRPDEHVGVPDRRHAVFGHPKDFDALPAGFIKDRGDALGLGKREEGPLHEIALIAGAGIAGGHHERIEPFAFAALSQVLPGVMSAPGIQRDAFSAGVSGRAGKTRVAVFSDADLRMPSLVHA